jgi:hypothetical protein
MDALGEHGEVFFRPRHRRDAESPGPAPGADSPPAQPVADDLGGTGAYLTNEIFLYRIVSVVATAVGEMVDLEDCFGLDVVRVPLEDLRSRGLRVVTPARVHT